MSDLFVDNIKHQSSQGSGTITIGASGETVALAAGATQSGFGLSGWSEDGANNNLLPASASAGIYLGVNSATASNLLDDYEEGTWTPSFIFTSGSITTNTNGGLYIKIGNLVYIVVQVAVASVSSPSGDFRISSLPFTPDVSSGFTPAFAMSYYDWNSGTYFLNGELNGGNSNIYIYSNNNGVRTNPGSLIKGGSQFHLTGSYIST